MPEGVRVAWRSRKPGGEYFVAGVRAWPWPVM